MIKKPPSKYQKYFIEYIVQIQNITLKIKYRKKLKASELSYGED